MEIETWKQQDFVKKIIIEGTALAGVCCTSLIIISSNPKRSNISATDGCCFEIIKVPLKHRYNINSKKGRKRKRSNTKMRFYKQKTYTRCKR